MDSIPKELGFYTIKIIAIMVVSIYYFIFGSIISVFVNKFTPERNVKRMTTFRLIVEIATSFAFIGVFYYFLRKFIRVIPFPLDGYFGFKNVSLREMTGGIIVAFVIFTYQTKLTERLLELRERAYNATGV